MAPCEILYVASEKLAKVRLGFTLSFFARNCQIQPFISLRHFFLQTEIAPRSFTPSSHLLAFSGEVTIVTPHHINSPCSALALLPDLSLPRIMIVLISMRYSLTPQVLTGLTPHPARSL